MAGGMVPYIFGGNTDIQNYEELKRRRAVATAIAARQRGMPKTLGEGMTYLGESIGDRMQEERLLEMERAQGGYDRENTKSRPDVYAPGAAPGGAALPPGVGPDGPVPVAANPARDSLVSALAGPAPQEVAQANPTIGAEMPRGGPLADAAWSARAHAIGGIESDQDYNAVGVPTKYGRAMGRYGVIEANVGPWTQAALGQALTPQQFLTNPKAQDAVFQHRFSQYVAKYGEEGAARAWYGGPGNVNNPNAMDQHERLTVRDYGQDYLKRLQGRRSDAGDGSSPVQLAALGGPAGTMTDAPPPGAGARPSGVEPEPDPTVTEDIRPMSVRTQIAQAPASLISGSVAGVPGVPAAGVLAPPPGAPGATVPAPNIPPSARPIPPFTPEEYPDPGPKPVPPPRYGLSDAARDYARMANDPRLSDERRAWAEKQFGIAEGYRKEVQARADAAYVNDRELWEARDTARQKHKMETPTRDVKQLNDLVSFEKGQHEARRAPIETALKQAELNRDPIVTAKLKQELRNLQVEHQQKLRTLYEPKTLDVAGTRLQAPYNPATGTYGPYARPPGAPEAEEKAATEPQQKAIQFVLRTRDDLNALERNDGKPLTDKFEAAKTWIPFGANLVHSDEYRKTRNAVDNWGAAFMSHVSGAAITPSEAARQLPAFVPAAGDDDKELAEKTRRRRQFTDAVEASGGKPTHDAIMKVLKEASASVFEKEAAKPPALVKSPEEAAALPPGRRFIGHDGKERQRALTP